MAMLETPQAEGVQTKADRANYRTNYEQAFGHTDARIGRSGRALSSYRHRTSICWSWVTRHTVPAAYWLRR